MKTVWTTLLIDEDTWALGLSNGRVVRVIEPANLSSEASVKSKVEAAVTAARQAHPRFGPLVVGLPSAWCMSAAVSADGLQRRQCRQGLIYRLEERLPINAEDFTADFTPGSTPGSGDGLRNASNGDGECPTPRREVLGIAVHHAKVAPIIDALEAAGLTVAHLVPTACLAYAGLDLQVDRDRPDHLAVLATNASSIDLILTNHGQTIRWVTVPRDPQAMFAERQALIGHLNHNELACASVGVDESEYSFINSWALSTRQPATDGDVRQLAVVQASRLLKLGRPPLVDLRRDALAGRERGPASPGPP